MEQTHSSIDEEDYEKESVIEEEEYEDEDQEEQDDYDESEEGNNDDELMSISDFTHDKEFQEY